MINWKRLRKSFGYAVRGFLKVWHNEQNFRVEMTVGCAVIVVALLLRVSFTDLAILILTIGFVLLMEIVNSLVELLSDLLKPRLDHYVKTVKDVGAAAVMTASLTAIFIGLIIFSKYIIG